MNAASRPIAKQPTVVVIAGPNGAGKSTAAPFLLKQALGILEFVNADQIATGLSAYSPETVSFEAGRIMLKRLRELATAKVSFAFESTLSSRTFALFLTRCKAQGYTIQIFMLRCPVLSWRSVGLRCASNSEVITSQNQI
jgi:predicted ABC-type ATPase